MLKLFIRNAELINNYIVRCVLLMQSILWRENMSYLFHEFSLVLKFGGSLALGDRERFLYHQAKKEFLSLIPRELRGVEFVRKAYELMDQLAAENTSHYPIVCKSGCSQCCNQMVCCTHTEMRLIFDYLASSRSSEKRKIKAAAIKRSVDYRAIIPDTALLGLTTRFEGLDDPLRKRLYGRPCPFLRHKKCGIYPVRPPDCRSARVLESPCGTEGKRLRGLKFFLDQIVADVLIEEDLALRGGEPQIAPLFCWIISQDFFHKFS